MSFFSDLCLTRRRPLGTAYGALAGTALALALAEADVVADPVLSGLAGVAINNVDRVIAVNVVDDADAEDEAPFPDATFSHAGSTDCAFVTKGEYRSIGNVQHPGCSFLDFPP